MHVSRYQIDRVAEASDDCVPTEDNVRSDHRPESTDTRRQAGRQAERELSRRPRACRWVQAGRGRGDG